MFQNLSIRAKFAAIIVIPIVALAAVVTAQVRSNVSSALAARDTASLASFAVQASDLIRELQVERDLSAPYLTSANKQLPLGFHATMGTNLTMQRQVVDGLLREFRSGTVPVLAQAGDRRVKESLDAAVAKLGRLEQVRREVSAGQADFRSVFGYYSDTIGDLIAVIGRVTANTTSRELANDTAAFVALARVQDLDARIRGYLAALLGQTRASQADLAQVASLSDSRELWFTQFLQSADARQQRLYRDTVTGLLVDRADNAKNKLLGLIKPASALGGGTGQSGQGADVDLTQIDPTIWLTFQSPKIDLVRQVEIGIAADVTAAANAAERAAVRRAVTEAALIGVVLLLMILLSLTIARSMERPLQRLTRAALDVANRQLPDAVERLQQSADPEAFDLASQPAPIAVAARDEIGKAVYAFNAIHQVALRVAVEQAGLRRSIGDMFLNMARRSETLIDRQLELIEVLESNEADPDRLEELFKLDHLATRMRRNAEDLIVLSGTKQEVNRWSLAMPLVDVVRAAVAEVEEYQRVELLPLAERQVPGHAAVDVIHLLAELIENATSFSPPNTSVHVGGQEVASGYVLEVEDRGFGMSDDELVRANERLANPPTIDFALSRVLGLYVVAKLAQRHGIKVQLRHSWYGGITALVLLPSAVMLRPEPDKLTPALSGGPSTGGLPPQLGSPVAAPQAGPARGHTPIFEETRSAWFQAADSGSPFPQPQRRSPRARAAQPSQVGDPAPASLGQLEQPELVPLDAAEGGAPADDRTVAGAHPQAAAAASAAQPPTGAGLPRRVPQADLAPGLAAEEPGRAHPDGPAPAPGLGRSPEEVRSMLSNYRAGWERGRHTASGERGGSPGGERR
jgi:signal transduction histidine kinase